jgi:hypothetical protein
VYKRQQVYPLSFTTKDGEFVVGYVREPKRQAKMVAMSQYLQRNLLEAGETVFTTSLLSNESDTRLNSDDNLYLAACTACVTILEFYANESAIEIKKN